MCDQIVHWQIIFAFSQVAKTMKSPLTPRFYTPCVKIVEGLNKKIVLCSDVEYIIDVYVVYPQS